MALKLIDPVYSQMPFFQPNQVLTYNHLNDLAGYLYQQERYTRNKLMGSGIVCGLSFSWTDGASNATVLIDEGCAITSAGYLIVFKQPQKNGAPVAYTRKRVFERLKDIPPFNDVANIASSTVYELITQDEYDSETLAAKSVLANNDKNGMVLIMLFDLQALNVAKCLDESCDDKGKVYDFTPRPLLVPIGVINSIVDAASSKLYYTEPGRGHKAKDSILFEHNYLYVKSLFREANLQEVDSVSELADIFKYPCQDDVLNAYKQTIDNLLSKFPWIFNTQTECMKAEIPALSGQTLGTLFMSKVKTFRDNAANKNYVQYAYDFLRDVMDAYNEMLDSVSDLVSECGGNEHLHPFHVMLGKPQSYDTLACYHEEKYSEQQFKYRHSFVPSPIVCGQYMLYEKVLHQFKRLVRIIANFNVNQSDTTIKIISGKDYEAPIGERVIPYFYTNTAIDSLKRVWNYSLTRRNKASLLKGYQLSLTQELLLQLDTARSNFFRIEGHIGKTGSTAKTEIEALRKAYNLPFNISTVSIQQETKSQTCSFPDLEEEYSFYRDRAMGYLKEVMRWLDEMRDLIKQGKNTKAIVPYYELIAKAIKKMMAILDTPCLDKFDYAAYKEAYVAIWNVIFEIYYVAQKEDMASAVQALNTSINIMNVLFFQPIYKIWFMYQYRMAMLTEGHIISLKLLAAKSPGAEHLAGVRRGETFLMVTDQAQGGKVVADFSLPGQDDCDCNCQADLCDGTRKAIVSPLQKPIIMVVDYESEKVFDPGKTKAVYDEDSDAYYLELDAMGFYKGGSTIAHKVTIFDQNKKEYKKLTAQWEGEKLTLMCKNKAISDGAYALYYELKGNFEEHSVTGIIYLFVRGRVKVAGGTYTVAKENVRTYLAYYPYDKAAAKRVTMKFEDPFESRMIGSKSYMVLRTQNGNEIGIADEGGKAYLKMITANTTGIEYIPVIVSMEGAAVRTEVVLNVVDTREQYMKKAVEGKVYDDQGAPLKDARVSYGDNEVITDAEGNYKINDLKAGDVITIEKGGYKVSNLQVNNKMETQIRLRKDNTINIPGLENIKLPDFGSLVKGFNAGNTDIKQ
jgi:hypothetical protein